MTRWPLILLAPLAIAASSRHDPLAGMTPGAPQQCIDLPMQTNVEIVDEHTILYHESGRRIWRTGPIGDCPALRPLTTLITEPTTGSQLCRHDHFRVLEPDQLIPSSICFFDTFTPYTKAAPAK